MTRIALLANLLAYSFVASQPLFYVFALTRAQRGLSGPAYVELRQHVNAVMKRRLPVVYAITLVTTLTLLVLSWRERTGTLLVTTAFALLCLLADVALMLRESLPLNEVVDRWSITDLPEDWDVHRTRWFAAFGRRQVVLLAGFVGLLVGVVADA